MSDFTRLCVKISYGQWVCQEVALFGRKAKFSIVGVIFTDMKQSEPWTPVGARPPVHALNPAGTNVEQMSPFSLLSAAMRCFWHCGIPG